MVGLLPYAIRQVIKVRTTPLVQPASLIVCVLPVRKFYRTHSHAISCTKTWRAQVDLTTLEVVGSPLTLSVAQPGAYVSLVGRGRSRACSFLILSIDDFAWSSPSIPHSMAYYNGVVYVGDYGQPASTCSSAFGALRLL